MRWNQLSNNDKSFQVVIVKENEKNLSIKFELLN